MTVTPARSAPSARQRVSVLLRLDPVAPAHGDVVVSAALQLFTPDDAVDLVIRLRGVGAPEQQHAEGLARRCAEARPDAAPLPEIVLLADDEEPDHAVVLELDAGLDVPGDARAVILLTSLAREVWARAEEDAVAQEEVAAPSGPAAVAAAGAAGGLLDEPTGRPAATLRLRDPALGGDGPGDGAEPSGLARLVSARRVPAGPPAGVPTQTPPGLGERARRMQALRAAALARIEAVDADRHDRLAAGPVRVAVLVQHLDSWGALETIARALAVHPRVDLELVALDSSLSTHPGESAELLRRAGYAPRDEAWLRAATDRADLDVLVLCDGYDEFRPEGLRVPDFAAAGVRLVYSPYGTNIGGETIQELRQYDGVLHNLAWRVYAPTTGQRDLFARRCTVGAGHVRAVGSVKRERVLALPDPAGAGDGPGAALRAAVGRERVVLWNPHFTLDPDGWSTFHLFLEPLLGHVAARDDLGLLVRPHFRLVSMLASMPELAGLRARLQDALAGPGVALDDSRDYLAAFAAADAMISDQSSLIPEFLPRRRPVLYLHRPGGAPLNSDATFMAALPAADAWPAVASFLDDVAAGTAAVPAAEEIGDEHVGAGDAGAGQRVAQGIVTDLLAELGLS